MDILAVNTAGVLDRVPRGGQADVDEARRQGRQHRQRLAIGALTGSPGRFIHYGGSKAAVDTMTMGLAAEVGATASASTRSGPA